MTQEKWGQLRQRLLKTVGQNNYTTWIEPLKFRDLEDGVATFDVPTNFLGNYVSQNFADLILHELRSEDGSIRRLNFAVVANSQKVPSAARSTQTAESPALSSKVLRPHSIADSHSKVSWSANPTNWPMPQRSASLKVVR